MKFLWVCLFGWAVLILQEALLPLTGARVLPDLPLALTACLGAWGGMTVGLSAGLLLGLAGEMNGTLPAFCLVLPFMLTGLAAGYWSWHRHGLAWLWAILAVIFGVLVDNTWMGIVAAKQGAVFEIGQAITRIIAPQLLYTVLAVLAMFGLNYLMHSIFPKWHILEIMK